MSDGQVLVMAIAVSLVCVFSGGGLWWRVHRGTQPRSALGWAYAYLGAGVVVWLIWFERL